MHVNVSRWFPCVSERHSSLFRESSSWRGSQEGARVVHTLRKKLRKCKWSPHSALILEWFLFRAVLSTLDEAIVDFYRLKTTHSRGSEDKGLSSEQNPIKTSRDWQVYPRSAAEVIKTGRAALVSSQHPSDRLIYDGALVCVLSVTRVLLTEHDGLKSFIQRLQSRFLWSSCDFKVWSNEIQLDQQCTCITLKSTASRYLWHECQNYRLLRTCGSLFWTCLFTYMSASFSLSDKTIWLWTHPRNLCFIPFPGVSWENMMILLI